MVTKEERDLLKKEVADRLNECLDALKLKDSEIAKRLDMSPQTLYAYKEGQSVPGGDILRKFSARLGIDVNYLLTGERLNKDINVKKGIYNESPIKGIGNTVTNQMGNDVEVQVLREKVRLLEEQNTVLNSVITDLRKQNNYLLNKLMEGENK